MCWAGLSIKPFDTKKYFNIDFVLKGLIERLAQHIVTAANGPRAEALALVLPDSELPAF